MVPATSAMPDPDGRHYGMDWLRIGAFGLLILYHIGMYFVPWDWHVKPARTVAWLTYPMLATNGWRLSLLFLVSGYASAALLARSGRIGPFLRARLARLGIPVLFGMAVVVPSQPWIQLSTQHGYPHGFLHFWARDYFGFKSMDGIVVPTWQHLWFVVYLLVYTLVLGLLLVALPPRARRAARQGAERLLAGPGLVALPILYLVAVRAVLFSHAEENHALAGDWIAHLTFLPMFLLGLLLRGAAGVWAAIARWWPWGFALALAAGLGAAGLEWRYPGRVPLPEALRTPYLALRMVQAWGMIVGLLGLADRWGNRDHRWRATLAEAVFPFYIIHQTIIVAVGWALLPTATGLLARFLIMLAATVAGCGAFYLVGRAAGPLRPLIGLKRARPERPPHPA